MAQISPYKISIPQEKLDRLKQKLALADFPDELEGANWDYGAPLADIKRLTAHWQHSYDWRKAEAELNEKLPQFTLDIPVDGFETLKIHFVHQKSQVKGAIPLLFAHGWPGSFDEVRKLIPDLVKGDKDTAAFHVVAPSLPNFGFSQGTKKRGFTSRQHGEVCHKLMQALGYTQYGSAYPTLLKLPRKLTSATVAQGGDIGYSVIRTMALFYPESCRATHTNFANPSHPDARVDPALFLEAQQTPLTAAEKAGYAHSKWFATEGTGYNVQQSTKPQTIGYSVADSPVGLLAWIYEKLHDWTDGYPWTDDEVLTWVSIYWFSAAGPAASQRIYYESRHDVSGHRAKLATYIADVKLGTAKFPKELMQFPKLWNKTLGPLVLASEHEHGGHFAAWERPDAIVQDLRHMFGRDGGAYAVVHGRTGFDDS